MQDTSPKQQTKQKDKQHQQQTDYHLTQPCPSEEKQTNKQKNSAQISPCTNHWTTLGGQKPKGRKNSTFFKEKIQLSWKPGKGDLRHNNLKILKRQRNTAQMKEQTRNTEIQINEEEIGKLPEKEFIIMIVKMIKTLGNKMEKMQESFNKDLEELKNKHTETNNTITEIKNTREGINSRISEE